MFVLLRYTFRQFVGVVSFKLHFFFTAREFDAAKHFDTHPAFVDRKCNRPKRSMLEGATVDLEQNEETMRVSNHPPPPRALTPYSTCCANFRLAKKADAPTAGF